MSSNDLPSVTEDFELLESDGEKVVTMMDVLQEQQDFEDDANAVLGACDEKNCTYPKGYIKRQAVFACLTCCTEAKTDPTKRAGVCLACSLSCHENHELIELYTKRNFCCDCGNPKFNSNPCQFLPQKPDMNVNNDYNQNFSGLYCTCHRPYPDPESTFDDEMIQCILCEDWLHSSHLESTVPPNEQYSEMICKSCMQKNEFLYDYSELAVNVDVEVDVVTVNGTGPNSCNGTECINGNSSKTETEEEIEKSNLDIDMAEKCDKPTEPSVEDQKEITEKPEEPTIEDEKEMSVKPADHIAEDNTNIEDTVTEEENSGTVTDNKETGDIPPNINGETVPTDSEMSENNIEPLKDVEQTEQNEVTDDTADSNENKELQVSNSNENDSTLATQTTDITSESNDNNAESIEENKDLKVQDITALSTNKESNTTTEESNSEETKAAEQNTNENDLENKDADVKCSDDFEPNVIKENAVLTDVTQHDDSKDDVLESIDKIINDNNDETYAEKPKTEEQVTDETESDYKETINDNESISNDIEMKEDDKDDVNSPIGHIEAEANDEETEQNNLDETKAANEERCNENKRKLVEDINEDTAVKKLKLENTKNCNRPRDVKKKLKGATFWPSNFRQMLCTCNECLTMYKDLSVLFLIDPEDTVTAYEMLGKEMTEAFGGSQYEKGLQALSSLDRIQQINALTEYNKMRDKLLEFLKSFKDRQEIVKEEDIRAFFAGMKPKREPDGVYFCR